MRLLVRTRPDRTQPPNTGLATWRRLETGAQDSGLAGAGLGLPGGLGGQPNPAREQVNPGSVRQAGFLDQGQPRNPGFRRARVLGTRVAPLATDPGEQP